VDVANRGATVNAPTLRELRERAGMNMRETAAAMGVSVTYLSDVERGKRRLAPKHIGAFSNFTKWPAATVAYVCGYCSCCFGTGDQR
jgi:DNA-binding XRE family transcriptional regulator